MLNMKIAPGKALAHVMRKDDRHDLVRCLDFVFRYPYEEYFVNSWLEAVNNFARTHKTRRDKDMAGRDLKGKVEQADGYSGKRYHAWLKLQKRRLERHRAKRNPEVQPGYGKYRGYEL